ncbi:Hypothetical predicted protein [Octopus vulgaris]|uniref:Uncharacterized protein n=1 Tax=Octopus vulgaris TaxID=6645 RepID=A0AA36BDW0_OCTVU|nr:Hypothetical predicted protein [Octopus vulgaris]
MTRLPRQMPSAITLDLVNQFGEWKLCRSPSYIYICVSLCAYFPLPLDNRCWFVYVSCNLIVWQKRQNKHQTLNIKYWGLVCSAKPFKAVPHHDCNPMTVASKNYKNIGDCDRSFLSNHKVEALPI